MQVVLPVIGTVAAWRAQVRRLAAAGTPPETVVWSLGEARPDLFAGAPATGAPVTLRLTRAAVDGLETAMLHADAGRFALGHTAVLRLSQGNARWGDRSDPSIGRLLAMEKAVRRDIHKMHAFVRFRELPPARQGRRRFAAWFEPSHNIAEATGPFFANRFGDMDWAIATPTVTLIFDGALRVEVTAAHVPTGADAAENLWRTYFTAIFNPARLKPAAMQAEMPRKYWKNLPEADLIPALIAGAPAAVQAMHARALSEAPPAFRARAARARAALAPPEPGSLPDIAAQARACTRCPLHGPATQTVFGEGPPDARLMIVGEAPGDAEDLRGRPFVGPAGQLLDALLEETGGRRGDIWMTNAVKHFRYRAQGRGRLHVTPDKDHVEHCRWWLDHERRLIRPRVIMGLGRTGMYALTGDAEGLAQRVGQVERLADGTAFVPAFHPAYILRLPDPTAARTALRDALALALRLAA
jgi:DNA polymerase